MPFLNLHIAFFNLLTYKNIVVFVSQMDTEKDVDHSTGRGFKLSTLLSLVYLIFENWHFSYKFFETLPIFPISDMILRRRLRI